MAWKVPKSGNYPEGVKYSFVFVFNEKRAIAYDNFNNEGHHKHHLGKKIPYKFISLIETRKMFIRDVEKFEKSNKRW
ncbi:hypothetical protein KY366_08330 [Candidatus Woesearchaeota archaeon]|nr:hypothetical protein [Candidatus Woesearchaeota archaeon]